MAASGRKEVVTVTGASPGQYEALLEVSESIALHRNLRALFHDLFRLPRVVNFDSLSLAVQILEMEGRPEIDRSERVLLARPRRQGQFCANQSGFGVKIFSFRTP